MLDLQTLDNLCFNIVETNMSECCILHMTVMWGLETLTKIAMCDHGTWYDIKNCENLTFQISTFS